MNVGECLCRGIRFEITGDVFSFFHCHCKMCRKSHGTAYSSSALVKKRDFTLVAGHVLVAEYESSKGKKRCFCKKCGGRVFTILDYRPDYLVVNVGMIEGDPGVKPSGHLWVSEKAPWYEICDSLPQHQKNIENRGSFGAKPKEKSPKKPP